MTAPSDTPRTDYREIMNGLTTEMMVPAEFARELERELAEANEIERDQFLRAEENLRRAENAERAFSNSAIDAARYRWLRQQVKNKDAMVRAQALFWLYSSRDEFDRGVDGAMAETPLEPVQDRL
jgi:hypothetical protein